LSKEDTISPVALIFYPIPQSSGKIIFINPPVGIECCGLETNEY